jgi:putative transposase
VQKNRPPSREDCCHGNLFTRRSILDQYTQGRLARQVRRVQPYRQQVLDEQDLCLTKLLPQEQIEAALERHQVRYRKRLYTPLVTIWMFLYQALAADQSCRAAVARLLALLCVGKKGSGSAKTDPYCKARERLPEPLLADLARHSGAELQQQVPPVELLGGRPIQITDGTTLSMPDTPANQKAYPHQAAQKKGLGFPILRLVGLIGLSGGAVLDVAMAPYHGKRTGETALLRQLLGSLRAGDILLADAIFSNYWTIALLLEGGVDFLGRLEGRRRIDFRRGQRLGRCDHAVSWSKPHRPAWMSRRLYDRLPTTLRLRETQVGGL